MINGKGDTAMGYRYVMPNEKADACSYRIMEVVMVKRGRTGTDKGRSQVLTVDNHWDTLRYVQDNLDEFIANIIRVKKMNAAGRRKIEENAELFERNLEPLFSLISATGNDHLMGKLSSSLKKALFLMALDRYHCDKDTICRVLGITRDKLDREMRGCGL
jgi:hypothetical protein